MQNHDADNSLPGMQMLVYSFIWCAVCLAAIFVALHFGMQRIVDRLAFDYAWWIVLALCVVYIVADTVQDRRRARAALSDACRLDAIGEHRLVVVPPGTGAKYLVMRRDDEQDKTVFVGRGGHDVRSAIDNALLALGSDSEKERTHG